MYVWQHIEIIIKYVERFVETLQRKRYRWIIREMVSKNLKITKNNMQMDNGWYWLIIGHLYSTAQRQRPTCSPITHLSP